MLDPDHDAVVTQFNRLIEELLSGNLNRSRFQPWEIDILVDMVGCSLPGANRFVNILREYQNAVQQRILEGARAPLKLSEYLGLRNSRPPGAPLVRSVNQLGGFNKLRGRQRVLENIH
jgi:hypothetical protein